MPLPLRCRLAQMLMHHSPPPTNATNDVRSVPLIDLAFTVHHPVRLKGIRAGRNPVTAGYPLHIRDGVDLALDAGPSGFNSLSDSCFSVKLAISKPERGVVGDE